MAAGTKLAGTGAVAMGSQALIVGGGISGLTVAWALARSGLRVQLFEQGTLPNPLASSWDEHRIIRHAYGFLEGYARLMPEAFHAWDRLWSDLGRSHYEPADVLYVSRDDDGWFEASVASLEELELNWTEIALSELPKCFPMIEMVGVRRAMQSGGSGILYARDILIGLVRCLERFGVQFHRGSHVSSIDLQNGNLIANGTTIGGDFIVVSAGAWVSKLLPELGRDTVPSRQIVVYALPPDELATAWISAPPVLTHERGRSIYALPPRTGTRLKFSNHHHCGAGDPDGPRDPTDAEVDALWTGVRGCFRAVDKYRIVEHRICFYTLTQDERFLLRALGPRGLVVSACSGHGFKLAPMIAEGVARAVIGEISMEALGRWAAGRGLLAPT